VELPVRLVVPRVELPIVPLEVIGLDATLLSVVVKVWPGSGTVSALTVGGVTVTNGLTPALMTSEEPSGMMPPLRDDPTVVPGVDRGEAMPVEAVRPDDAERQGFDVVVVPEVKTFVIEVPIAETFEDAPPLPSKVALVPPMELIPPIEFIPVVEPVIEIPVQLALSIVGPIGVGLTPPGLSSVVPSGIPVVGSTALEPGMPSGDVAPSAGMLIVPWA
jgi:hypothetical protein